MKISNEYISLEFNESNGSLIQVKDEKTGHCHLGAPGEGELIKLFVPDEENDLSRHCFSSNSCKPDIRLENNKLDIYFNKMKTSSGELLDIKALAHITIPENTNEAIFSLEIINDSNELISEVFYPYVGGWRGHNLRGESKMTIGSMEMLDPNDLYFTFNQFLKFHRRRFYHVSSKMLTPFFDLSNSSGGIFNNCYSKKPFDGGLYIEDANSSKGDPHPAWSWNFRTFTKSKGTWKSPDIGIGVHSGDWHKAADKMREWSETWWTSPVGTEKLWEKLGIFMTSFRNLAEGNLVNTPDDIIKQAAECLDCGIDHILIWDMMMQSYYRAGHLPILEDAPEHVNELRKLLKKIYDMGMTASTWVNLRITNARSKEMKKIIDQFGAKSIYGYLIREGANYPIHSESGDYILPDHDELGSLLCASSKKFQEWALNIVSKTINLGFTSFGFDQPWERSMCFSQDHGHPIPASINSGTLEWITKAVEIIRENYEGATTIGEQLDIWNSGVINYNFIWDWKNWRNAEVYRYVLPKSLLMWSIDSCNQLNELSQAFAMGASLAVAVNGSENALSSAPQFAKRLKNLAALRLKTAEFTTKARFNDTLGISCESNAEIVAYGFDGEKSFSVIVGECSPMESTKGGGKLSLKIDLESLGLNLPKKVLCYHENGKEEEIKFHKVGKSILIEMRLDKWQCAVLKI
jgi:hypothetical protein